MPGIEFRPGSVTSCVSLGNRHDPQNSFYLASSNEIICRLGICKVFSTFTCYCSLIVPMCLKLPCYLQFSYSSTWLCSVPSNMFHNVNH